jgi:hypothetical protein
MNSPHKTDVELLEAEDGQARFSIIAGGRPTVTDVRLKYPEGEQCYEAAAGDIPDFSSLRKATFRPGRNNGGAQLKVWAHKVTAEGDSEGIVGLLHVRQGEETGQFDLKLSKGQVLLAGGSWPLSGGHHLGKAERRGPKGFLLMGADAVLAKGTGASPPSL